MKDKWFEEECHCPLGSRTNEKGDYIISAHRSDHNLDCPKRKRCSFP